MPPVTAGVQSFTGENKPAWIPAWSSYGGKQTNEEDGAIVSWGHYLLDVTSQTIMAREAQEQIKDYTPTWAFVSVKDM